MSMVDGVIIRPAEARDRATWAEMWEGYNRFYGVSLSDRVTAATWARILDPTSPIRALLAADGAGNTLGFANYILHPYTWSDQPACLLDDLFVRPEARGGGVGRALIDHLILLAQEQGWGRLYWMTRAGNAVARRLYDRFGAVDDFVRYTVSFDGARPTAGEA
jgi:GNAT superfamily N-acetyltransferase